MRRFRDFAACEDAVQEALIAAAAQWPRDGVPDNPRGWLIHVALRRMTDHVRSEIARRNREAAAAEDLPLVVAPAVFAEPGIDPDDTLVLLFMCCHPSLSSASAIALTLRAVGCLTTAEIASSFLVPEATIAQRISDRPEGSYTARLWSEGPTRIAQKVGEEGVEVALAAVTQEDERLVGESADLLYHLALLLKSRNLSLTAVVRELEQRHKAK
jgi:phosphoribosyl-ATP pyrophosphohydrolase